MQLLDALAVSQSFFWNEEILQIQSAPRAFAALRKDGAVFAWGDQTSGWDGMKGGIVLIEFFFGGFPQKKCRTQNFSFPQNFHKIRSFLAVLVIFW